LDKMTVRDIDVRGKRVIVRVDFNVPIDEKTGSITDDSRIHAALPTIQYLIRRGAKVIIISHLGRPKGKVVDSLRMTKLAQRFSQILGQQVGVATDCIGPDVEMSVQTLKNGDAILLENVRFHSYEETGSAEFAESLSKLGDIFVNDAFGTSHRAHASIVGINKYLPAVSGLLLEKEVDTLGGILKKPEHPFIALLGGAKVSDKVSMLENIMDKIDCMLIGGGMAATFLKASGKNVGSSLVEEDTLDVAINLIKKAEGNNVKILLPADAVVASNIESEGDIVNIDDIQADKSIFDIGPKTIELFSKELNNCKTVFWNGPMGIYEQPQFVKGTQAMANLLANSEATTIIGGGSTAEIVYEMGLADKMSFVSTGGGASLKFLSGNVMPGVEALLDKKS